MKTYASIRQWIPCSRDCKLVIKTGNTENHLEHCIERFRSIYSANFWKRNPNYPASTLTSPLRFDVNSRGFEFLNWPSSETTPSSFLVVITPANSTNFVSWPRIYALLIKTSTVQNFMEILVANEAPPRQPIPHEISRVYARVHDVFRCVRSFFFTGQ